MCFRRRRCCCYLVNRRILSLTEGKSGHLNLTEGDGSRCEWSPRSPLLLQTKRASTWRERALLMIRPEHLASTSPPFSVVRSALVASCMAFRGKSQVPLEERLQHFRAWIRQSLHSYWKETIEAPIGSVNMAGRLHFYNLQSSRFECAKYNHQSRPFVSTATANNHFSHS
jgi:hypothetical protein